MKIAVIGAGIAGVTAAELLQGGHEVTLFEATDRIGGHARSAQIALRSSANSGPLEVDVAFTLFNPSSYPKFARMLQRWGIDHQVRSADMSFSMHEVSTDFQYSVNREDWPIRGKKLMLFRPKFYQIIWSVFSFLRSAKADLKNPRFEEMSLARYLAKRRYPRAFIEDFIYPMGMFVWCMPLDKMMDLPAKFFLQLIATHRHFGADPEGGDWKTLSGSSSVYLRAFQNSFQGHLHLNESIYRIRRNGDGVLLFSALAEDPIAFDRAVIATHADQALALLENPSPREISILGAWKYHRQYITLHCDPSFMPKDPALWASWNLRFNARKPTEAAKNGVTYHLNRVHGLHLDKNYFLTLSENPLECENKVSEFESEHPIFDARAKHSQERLDSLDGVNHTYFCGSYFGLGLHEDSVSSAMRVAEILGCPLKS